MSKTSTKAPGKAYRKGISLIEVVKMFDTEEKAEQWFIEQRWPDGVTCPHCESDNIATKKSRKPQPYRCRTCRKHFSVKTRTLLHSSNIPLSKWAIAFYLYSTNLKGVSSTKLHRDLGIGQKAAWHMGQRIREMWDNQAEKFAGPVEVDQTYIGGKETNKHADKKLNAGRGTVRKSVLAGAKDRESGQVSAQVVPDTKKATLHGFIHDKADANATVYTDDLRSYQDMPFRHESVSHSVSEYVRDQAHVNGLESFWASLKRGYHGTYHQMSPKHLGRYINEFAVRHNDRPSDTIDQMAHMVQAMEGKQLRYEDLIAGGAAYPETKV